MRDNEIIKALSADKEKCPCAKCLYGQFGRPNGFSSWKCIEYTDGKPQEVLYENKECPKFKPTRR